MLRLQTELRARGFYWGALDGRLGRQTRKAIVKFEKDISQTPTGLPTLTLLRRLGEDRVKPSHLFSTGRGVVDGGQKRPAREKDEPETTFDPFHMSR